MSPQEPASPHERYDPPDMVDRPTHSDSASIEGLPAARPDDSLGLILGRGNPALVASLLLLTAFVACLAGLSAISTDHRYAFDPQLALDAIGAQLGATAVPALLVAAAALGNLVAGAIVVRLLSGAAFRSLADTALGGFAGAVMLDVALLFLLGTVGLFTAPAIFLVHLLIYAAAWNWARPLARGVQFRPPVDVPIGWWPIVALVWAAPIALQLASPAVPFIDVLPNHVAPVEHLRAYGSFDFLTIMPSPIYGPSRQFLGYVGVLGTMSVLTDLQAVLAVAAFALPETVLCGVAVHRLASSLFGRRAGYWALLTFPLTYAFLRLPDARATVVVIPLAAWALSLVVRRIDATEHGGGPAGVRTPTTEAAIRLAIAFSATILVHPIVGAACVATAAVATLFRPKQLAPVVIPAVGGSAAVALPQLATMLDIALPAWLGLPALALGAAFTVALARVRWPDALLRQGAQAILAGAFVAFLLVSRVFVPQLSDAARSLADFPVLTLATVAGIALTWRRGAGWLVLGAGIAVGIAVDAICQLTPADTLLEQSIKFEIPKTIGYWTPVLASIGAAAALGELSRRGLSARLRKSTRSASRGAASRGAASRGAASALDLDLPLRLMALAAVVAVATVPLFQASESPLDIVERSYTVSIADNLREAQSGYWLGYRDPRLIVDADGQGVIEFLRTEQRAGRLGPSTAVLHIASSFQQWVSIPVGVFTGAIETTATNDPEHSIHTVGGRLYGLGDVPSLLATSRYVVYEPSNVAIDFRGSIVGAGFRLVYSNPTALVYARGG